MHARLVGAEAGEQFEVFDGQEQPVAAGVGEVQAVVRRALHLDHLQPLEAADAVLHMHHQVAGREARQFGDQVGRLAAAPRPPHQPVAEDVLLGDDGEAVGLEARFEAKHDDADKLLRLRFDIGPRFRRRHWAQVVVA